MALYRLLRPKPRSHFYRTGLPRPRGYCSYYSDSGAEKSSKQKPKEAADEQKAVAAEAHVKKYVEMHPAAIPTQTKLQNEAERLFYPLTKMFTQLKEKMLGRHESQNHIPRLNPDHAAGTTVPDIGAHTCSDNTEFDEPKSTVQSSEATLNHLRYEKNISTNESSHAMVNSSKSMVGITSSVVTKMHNSQDSTELGEPENFVEFSETIKNSLCNNKNFSVTAASLGIEDDSSEDMVGKTVSEVSKMNNNLDGTEVGGILSTVQLSEILINSHSCKQNVSTSAMPYVKENSSGGMIQIEDIPETSELVQPGSRSMQVEKAIAGVAAVFDGDHKSKSGQLSCRDQPFLNKKASGVLQKDPADKLTSIGNGNCQHNKKIASFGQISSAGSAAGEKPAMSSDALEVTWPAAMFTETMNNKVPREMSSKKSYTLTPNIFSEDSNETRGWGAPERIEIDGLVDCIKMLSSKSGIFNQTNQVSKGDLSMEEKKVGSKDSVRRIPSYPGVQKSNSRGRPTSLSGMFAGKESRRTNEIEKEHHIKAPLEVHKENRNNDEREEVPCTETSFKTCKEYMNDDDEQHDSEFEVLGHASKPYSLGPHLTSEEDRKTFSIENVSEENKALMRFLLKSTPNREIVSALEDCGPIVKVSHFPLTEKSNFKDVYIYFETSAGLQQALRKTDLVVNNADVIVEGTSPLEDISTRILIPDLIGDPDVPVTLVKNPTKTAMINGLTLDMSQKHLEKALSFCGGGISGFIMGSSSSVAYVEFETEAAKERALAKHSFLVQGKSVEILRIDAPRTTVARISNIKSPERTEEIQYLCNRYGQVKNVIQREKETVDVQFTLAEWPNMLHILNRLNGKLVDDRRWVAQPATVYPPEILRALCNQPDGRRHVKAIIHTLLQKIGKSSTDTASLTELAAMYYGDGF